MTDFEEQQQLERPGDPSLAREIGSSLKAEFRTSMRWAFWGAALGAIVLGAAGLWFFGTTGLAIGAAIGAVAAGLGAWFLYLNA